MKENQNRNESEGESDNKMKMNIAIDETKQDWARVTDIPCIIPACPGLLRWAEAGYVPGYRICDCCGSHYALADVGGPQSGLRIERRKQPSPSKIESMRIRRQLAANANDKFNQDWLGKNTRNANVEWADAGRPSSHGGIAIPDESTSSASGCLIDEIQPEAFRALVRECWSLTRQLRMICPQRNPISVCHATRDGQHVMVYHITHTYGEWDGWWQIDALRKSIAAGSANEADKLAKEDRKTLNVWR